MIKIDININSLIGLSKEFSIKKNFSCFKDFLLNSNSLKIEKSENYSTYDNLFFIQNRKYYKITKSQFLDYITEKIKVCPYCGKTTLFKRKLDENNFYYSFDLDHFISKDKNPEFTRSLFNLIPICKACNSSFSKSNKDYLNGKYFHPYFGWLEINLGEWKISFMDSEKDFDDIFDFSKTNYDDISFKKDIFDECKKVHLKYFNLSEIYKYSTDTTFDYKFFLDKRDIINYRLSNSKNNKAKYELEKLRLIREYFRSWYPENKSEILKIPNGKMKKDLVEKLQNK